MSTATKAQVQSVLDGMKRMIEAVETRMKYMAGVDDPFVGVMVNAMLGGAPAGRPPFGPYKHPEDAADYLNAKRRAHGPKVANKYHGGDEWLPEHDGELFCHPKFTYVLIHTAEYYATVANSLMQHATALMMSTVGGTRPEPLPLDPIPSLYTLALATDKGNLIEHDGPAQLEHKPEGPTDAA